MEPAFFPCSKNGCPKIATDEVRYLLRQTPHSAPMETPVLFMLCSEHASEIEWKNVYNETDWMAMQKNYVDSGFLPPLVQLSCLDVRPMINRKSDGQ